MGSFNVACSVSGISICCGDPVAYFPLKDNDCRDEEKRFLIYANCLYEPVCLPIFGEYDDYGGVEVIRDSNVEIVEKHFEHPIGVIVNSDGPGLPKPITGGMFVHKEIYDHLVNDQLDSWGKDTGNKSLEQDFDKASKSIKIARAEAEKTIKWNKKYAERIEEDNPTLAAKCRAINPKFTWSLYGGEPSVFTYGTDYHDFRKLYYNSIENGKLKKELCDFWKFHMSMYSSNKHYAPAMNGEQCGNYYQARTLAQKTLEILKEKIKEQESW